MSSKNRTKPARSISGQIQRRLAPLIVLAWVLAALTTFGITRAELNEATVNNFSNLNHATARMLGTAVDDSKLPMRGAVYSGHQSEFFLLIQDPDGQIAHASHPSLIPPDDAPDGPLHWRGWTLFKSHTAGGRVIISGLEDEERDELLGQIVLSASLPVLVVLGALLFATLWFVRAGLHPLRELSEELGGRSPSAMNPLPEQGQPTDLRPILAALNALFSRLRHFLDRERKFIDDAAHELRTPLTIIKAQCQAIDPADLSEANRQRLANVIAGVNRAAALGNNLLAQARAEQSITANKAIDPEPLIRQALDDLHLTRAGTLATTSLAIGEAAPVLASAEDLRAILRNLLDNAALHGAGTDGSPAQIRVELSRSFGRVLIAVEDSGPGIPENQRSQVFERFYRQGPAKGTGLGLSIVQALADRNGIALSITRGPTLHGARFELLLTAAKTVEA